MSTKNEKQSSDHPQRDAKPDQKPVAGNAKFDPAEQSHRRDMDHEEHNGEKGSSRGSGSPGTGSGRTADKTPAIPMTQKDGGQHTG